MKDLHLPPTDQTCANLSAGAERALEPAATPARQAIAAYAAAMAGTAFDLDPDLESAGIDHLIHAGNAGA